MATLVLSTVGTALGGPVGSAIGALIGQSFDQQLFGSARGPRLGDLKVQSSSYGTQVPRIYGTLRVAGTIVWATDLTESSEMTGVKGQPDATYSYSVSFAVALSSRRAADVRRIWADGKLLRGEAGDFKVSTDFRFYRGGEDQVLDPLIASIEGMDRTPAYRDFALAVFENLELAEYGNRIPFLTFEVVADDESIDVAEVLADASSGLIEADDWHAIGGYAAYGQSVRSAIDPLVDCFGTELFEDGESLRAADRTPVPVVTNDFGNSADGEGAAQIEREQAVARALPAALRLGYHDPALDYQSGEARASANDRTGIEEKRELPAAVAASDAKALAQRILARTWAQRDKLTLRLPPRFLGLQPGNRLELDLSPRLWTVEQCTADGFVVVAELRPAWDATAQILADPGRLLANEDVAPADVTLALFDIPSLASQDSSAGPALMLAASTPSKGWKMRAVDIEAGGQIVRTETARRKSLLGRALAALPPGDAFLIDRISRVEVQLIDAEQELLSCDDQALFTGANLAVLGSELLQFGTVDALGDGRFRLSGLLRGRGGTEWAMRDHAEGEAFALLQSDRCRIVALPEWVGGSAIRASSRNLSGLTSDATIAKLSGESVRPRSPVGLSASFEATGDLNVAWTRRSRSPGWLDGIDAPLGESRERYRLVLTGSANAITLECSEAAARIAAGDLASLGPGPVDLEVRQVGDRGLSRAAAIVLTI